MRRLKQRWYASETTLERLTHEEAELVQECRRCPARDRPFILVAVRSFVRRRLRATLPNNVVVLADHRER